MRLGGYRIGLRLTGRLKRIGNRLSRARHFRGHGVHSPFAYALVREVFMRSELLPGDRAVYEALTSAGIARRRAVQLQNLAIHCRYATFGLNRADAELCVVTSDLPREQTLSLLRAATAAGHTVAVMAPYEGCERQALCRQIVAAHRSTSVDNRAYLLLFNNYLPKQHFKL